ncbi:MAG: Na+/H+ antiporter subunit E [Opitutales bacterium]
MEFSIVYIGEVLKSNFEVAYDVLTPVDRMKPAMIKVDVEGLSDRELLAFSNLITMTPGTLSVDVCEERKSILVHAMYSENPKELAQDINETLRKRIAHVF